MTNEEAIQIIKSECYVANLLNLDRTRMINTALDVAIEALKDKGYDQGYSDGFSDSVRVHRVLYGDRMKIGMNEMIPSNSMPYSNLGDCISREAVIRLVEQYPNIIGNRCSGLIADIKHLPPATTSYNSVKTELKPCEDAISREEALKVMCDKCPVYDCITGCSSYRGIEKLPPVNPKSEWISCAERLPEDYIHVLCQFTLGGMGECYLAHGVFHVVGGLVMTCNEVLAWMPLPERYKNDDEVNK